MEPQSLRREPAECLASRARILPLACPLAVYSGTERLVHRSSAIRPWDLTRGSQRGASEPLEHPRLCPVAARFGSKLV